MENNDRKTPQVGTHGQEAGQAVFYLAPLPLPTGARPYSSRSLLQQANDIYMDFSFPCSPFEFPIRVTITTAISMMLFLVLVGRSLDIYIHIQDGTPLGTQIPFLFPHYFMHIAIALYFLASASAIAINAYRIAQTPPIRFHHQKREVAYVAKRGQPPIIVPWEHVISCISIRPFMTYFGTQEQAQLMIGLRAPDKDEVAWLTMTCPNIMGAMSEWESIRVFMEESLIPRPPFYLSNPMEVEEASVHYFKLRRRSYRQRNGYLMYLLGFVIPQALGGWTLPCHLATWIQRLPSTGFPKSIIEWSRRLPPHQWQHPSDELVEHSQAVQRTLRKGRTLIDYFNAPPSEAAVHKPGSVTARRKRRKQVDV